MRLVEPTLERGSKPVHVMQGLFSVLDPRGQPSGPDSGMLRIQNREIGPSSAPVMRTTRKTLKSRRDPSSGTPGNALMFPQASNQSRPSASVARHALILGQPHTPGQRNRCPTVGCRDLTEAGLPSVNSIINAHRLGGNRPNADNVTYS
jgi:hypothetical protein